MLRGDEGKFREQETRRLEIARWRGLQYDEHKSEHMMITLWGTVLLSPSTSAISIAFVVQRDTSKQKGGRVCSKQQPSTGNLRTTNHELQTTNHEPTYYRKPTYPHLLIYRTPHTHTNVASVLLLVYVLRVLHFNVVRSMTRGYYSITVPTYSDCLLMTTAGDEGFGCRTVGGIYH